MLSAPAEGGFAQCVEALLRHRANLHAADAEGITAFLGAAAGGHGRTARVLMQHGADTTARDAVQRRWAVLRAVYLRVRCVRVCVLVDGVFWGGSGRLLPGSAAAGSGVIP